MAKNLEELRAENAELAEALLAEARAAVSASGAAAPAVTPAPAPQSNGGDDPAQAERERERKRIQEIDALAGLFDAETVRAAKYGEHACTAQEMTYRAARQAAAKGKQFLGDLEDDAKASGAAGVGAVPPPPDKGGEDPVAQARADAKAFNERKKEVR